MADLDATFAALTADVDHAPLWRSVWEESESDAAAGSFVPTGEAIGWDAWTRLATDDERADAFNELFYAYWQVAQHDAEQAALAPVHAELRALLAARREASRLGAPMPERLLEHIAALAAVLNGGA